MEFKKIINHIPFFPLSVLLFYFLIMILGNFDLIPQSTEIISFLEKIYGRFGLFGLFLVGLIEGLAYIGLYFPGNSIMALFFIFSDGSLWSFFLMILTVTLALTISSMINYWAGRLFFRNKLDKEIVKKSKKVEKSIFISVLHPDLLAFYFFYRGIKKKNFWKVFYVPLALIPYGFVFAFAVYNLSSFIREKLIGNPLLIFIIISIWFVIAFILRHKKDLLKGIQTIYKSLFT